MMVVILALNVQAAISTYYTKLASTVAQFGLLLKHLGVSQQALQAEAGRVLAGQVPTSLDSQF